ncbi:Uncharacterized protein QTN25_008632 [Entamoeba marina]
MESIQTNFKVVFYGNKKVGVSSIVDRFINDQFSKTVKPTGKLFDTKSVFLHDKQNTSFEVILDLYHQPVGNALTETPAFIGKADAIICVYSLNDRESFNDTENWMFFGKSFSEPLVQFILATKSDVSNKVVSRNDGVEMAKKLNVNYYEVSSLTFEVTLKKKKQENAEPPIEKPTNSSKCHTQPPVSFKRFLSQNQSGYKKLNSCDSVVTDEE